jgi:hypothetical protein
MMLWSAAGHKPTRPTPWYGRSQLTVTHLAGFGGSGPGIRKGRFETGGFVPRTPNPESRIPPAYFDPPLAMGGAPILANFPEMGLKIAVSC